MLPDGQPPSTTQPGAGIFRGGNSRVRWVPWDSIPDLDRDSLAFAYIRLRRDSGAGQTHSRRGIVLSECLALGTEALDSCKDLAGTLFDSSEVRWSLLSWEAAPASAAPGRGHGPSFGY